MKKKDKDMAKFFITATTICIIVVILGTTILVKDTITLVEQKNQAQQEIKQTKQMNDELFGIVYEITDRHNKCTAFIAELTEGQIQIPPIPQIVKYPENLTVEAR